eukprot:gene20240-26277_t
MVIHYLVVVKRVIFNRQIVVQMIKAGYVWESHVQYILVETDKAGNKLVSKQCLACPTGSAVIVSDIVIAAIVCSTYLSILKSRNTNFYNDVINWGIGMPWLYYPTTTSTSTSSNLIISANKICHSTIYQDTSSG